MMVSADATGRELRIQLAHERAARMYEDIARVYVRQGDLERARYFVRRARRHAPRQQSVRRSLETETSPATPPLEVAKDDRGVLIGEFDDVRRAEQALRALVMARAGNENELLLWALDRNGKAVGIPRDIFDLE